MKKEKFSTRTLAEIAIFAALGFALDAIQGGIWRGVFVNGGSIGFAMIPVLVIAYRRGLTSGILCGLILSIVQMFGGIYVINASSFESEFLKTFGPFMQILLDYVLGYTLVGLAGIFARKYRKGNKTTLWIVLGCILGGGVKYACHTLAGIMFWPGELWGVSGAAYSFLYNGLYCIPNIIIACVIMVVINKFYPQFLNESRKEQTND